MGTKSSKESECSTESNPYFDISDDKLPVVYNDNYNISFLGLQKLHPFDSCKWGRIVQILIDKGYLQRSSIIEPREITQDDLLMVHTKRYIDSLKYSYNVAMVTELAPIAMVPNSMVQKILLKPLRYQTGGTVLAVKVASERGWSINIGGGFHHCSGDSGGGFCAYADITLAIRMLMKNVDSIKKVMIIDLDAHQGNGHERDFMDDENIYIFDVYNGSIYPGDTYAKSAIRKKIELRNGTEDDVYLDYITRYLEESLEEFHPDFAFYNAGTDILTGDPLGCLNVSAQGIIKRDEIVFKALRQREIPVTMVTSGGYQRKTAEVIAESILNLENNGLLTES